MIPSGGYANYSNYNALHSFQIFQNTLNNMCGHENNVAIEIWKVRSVFQCFSELRDFEKLFSLTSFENGNASTKTKEVLQFYKDVELVLYTKL